MKPIPPPPPAGFGRVRFVYDGMMVYVHVKGALLLCEVACAAGNEARVVNDMHGINRWVDVDDLRVRTEET